MKIKGHSRIELRDAKTGIITDVREQDNFVTEFPSELFKQMGYLRPNAFANRDDNPIDDLFGGIMCFDTAITQNADMTGRHSSPLYPPADKNMTANGSILITDNRTPSELGQYNPNESLASDGFVRRFVYDWDTNEGNGPISSVCLTSKYGGYIGAGNHTSRTADRNIRTNQPMECNVSSTDAQFSLINLNQRPIYINWSTNVVGVIQGLDLSQGILVVAEYDIPIVSINPFKNLSNAIKSRKVSETTYNFTPITDAASYIDTFSHYGYWGLVIFSKNPNSSDVVANVLRYNLDATQEQYRITNMGPFGYDTGRLCCFAFLHNYFITFAPSKAYDSRDAIIKAINLSTRVVTDLGRGVYTNQGTSLGSLIQLEDVVYTNGYAIKVVNGSIVSEPINGASDFRHAQGQNMSYGLSCGSQAIDNPYIIFNGNENYDDNQWCFTCNGTLWRSYLATISNLQDPVVKTADKTMKITYTLTLLEQN